MNQDNAPLPVARGMRDVEPKPGELLNQASFDLLPFKTPAKRYLILSSQRTGSNYLCRRLCNVKDRFGLPSEYLHPKALRALTQRLVAPAPSETSIPLGKYMRAIERARTTDDGWFGIKAQPLQVLHLVGMKNENLAKFATSFDRVVLMTRHDKLGQAISGAIAQQTGAWMNDGKEPELDESRLDALIPLVAQNLARYIQEERLILDIGKTLNRPTLRIGYEEIEQDADAAFLNLVDFLAEGEALELEEEDRVPTPKKPAGIFANALRKRFIDYLSEMGPTTS